MRTRLIPIVAFMAFAAMGPAWPTSAQAEDVGDPNTVTMSVLGGVESTTPTPAELASNTGRLETLNGALGADDKADADKDGVVTNYTDPPSPSAYTVRLDWVDAYGNGVSQRYGRTGSGAFGWRHHYYDHNMSTNIARQITNRSDSHNRYVSGQKYEWTNIARRYRCSTYSCTLIDQRDVLVAVDYRILSDNKNFGVVTGYCVGTTLCPDWVNNGN